MKYNNQINILQTNTSTFTIATINDVGIHTVDLNFSNIDFENGLFIKFESVDGSVKGFGKLGKSINKNNTVYIISDYVTNMNSNDFENYVQSVSNNFQITISTSLPQNFENDILSLRNLISTIRGSDSVQSSFIFDIVANVVFENISHRSKNTLLSSSNQHKLSTVPFKVSAPILSLTNNYQLIGILETPSNTDSNEYIYSVKLTPKTSPNQCIVNFDIVMKDSSMIQIINNGISNNVEHYLRFFQIYDNVAEKNYWRIEIRVQSALNSDMDYDCFIYTHSTDRVKSNVNVTQSNQVSVGGSLELLISNNLVTANNFGDIVLVPVIGGGVNDAIEIPDNTDIKTLLVPGFYFKNQNISSIGSLPTFTTIVNNQPVQNPFITTSFNLQIWSSGTVRPNKYLILDELKNIYIGQFDSLTNSITWKAYNFQVDSNGFLVVPSHNQPATTIIQSTNMQFVSQAQIDKWDSFTGDSWVVNCPIVPSASLIIHLSQQIKSKPIIQVHDVPTLTIAIFPLTGVYGEFVIENVNPDPLTTPVTVTLAFDELINKIYIKDPYQLSFQLTNPILVKYHKYSNNMIELLFEDLNVISITNPVPIVVGQGNQLVGVYNDLLQG